jgi:hypothetical protein
LLPGIFGDTKLAVNLVNIQINTDRQMIGGEVVGVYDTNMSQIANLDDFFEGGTMYGQVSLGTASTDLTVNFAIPDDAVFVFDGNSTIAVKNKSGQITGNINISGLSGREEVFPLTVKDSEGNIYKIENENGILKAGKIGKENVPIPDGTVDYTKLATDKATVTFQKSGKYTFDEWITAYKDALLIRSKYKATGDYWTPFKLIPPGKTDEVRAAINIKDKSIDPQKVIFKTPKGTEYACQYQSPSKSYSITVSGGKSGDGQEIYALYPDGKGGYWNLGKLIVVSYPERTYNMRAVAVNGSTVNVNALSNKLNEIYNPIGISWKVTSDAYNYSGSTQFMEKGSGLLSVYPEAMRTFHNTYLTERDIDNKTAVVFFFNQYGAGGKKDRNTDGFMPRGKQFGYMFTKGFANNNDLYTGVAHELGHGMFQLKHPFDNDYKIPASTTNNLMDYTAGATHIAKWQWDLIHDPGVIVRMFERDEDAMTQSLAHLLEYIRAANMKGESSIKITLNNMPTRMMLPKLQLSTTKSIDYCEISMTMPKNTSSFTINTYKLRDKCRTCREAGYTQYMFNDTDAGFSMVVIIKTQDEKIFERYLFPAPEGTLQAKLESDNPLTREEANEIRDEYIEKIQDPAKKKEAYYLLQEKVTLVDPENFRGIVAKECIDACDSILVRHYAELGQTYTRPYESWSLATQDSASIYIHTECYDKAINYLDEELGKGNPVMVGVDYQSGHPGNYDNITDHWVVITARRQDAKGVYYTYMEVAQRETKHDENEGLGTSTDKNRFYFDEKGNYLVAINPTVRQNREKPIVTVIRGISNDNCCKRSTYVKNEKTNKANRINKDNADGTFIVIRSKQVNY